MVINGVKSASLPASVSVAQAAKALRITSQAWAELGQGEDPDVAASRDLNVIVERLTALLLIRIVAWLQPPETYTDLSTSNISKKTLDGTRTWPEVLTRQVMDELQLYVKTVLEGYQTVPYHNFEHCYHVTISVNKVMDMIMEPLSYFVENAPETYGFKDDPLMQLALLFAALIHDVEHRGVSNRQLANEDDHLAIQFNDTSVMEQHSLFFAFSELLKPEYQVLRDTVFPEKEDYRRFRKAVVNLVLCTDIADPERSQLSKSKWKEAFGDPYETVERKMRKARNNERRPSSSKSNSKAHRRMSTQSLLSEISQESPRLIGGEIKPLSDDSSVSLSPDEGSSETGASDNDAKESCNSSGQNSVIKKPDLYLDLQKKNCTNEMIRTPSKASVIASYDKYEVPLNTGSPTQSRRTKNERMAKNTSNIPGLTPGKFRRLRVQDETIDISMHSAVEGSGKTMSGLALKFRRRLSSAGDQKVSRRRARNTRLGLLRTVDLSGEQIHNFKTSRRASAVGTSHIDKNNSKRKKEQKVDVSEEANELRETVVMETILLACDVAHNLQGWEQMAKWSNRLFFELRRAYVNGRGMDPTDGWYSNQIGFLEAYLLPLARKLDDTGVFGDERGSIFADIVEENRNRWTREGMSLTANVITKGIELFPEAESDTEATL
jgi:hypothetical protein